MFDAEFASVLAIFAGIVALIVYINERSKRRIKTQGPAIVLKKFPNGHSDDLQPEPSGSEFEEWNFPTATTSVATPPSMAVESVAPAQPKAYAKAHTPQSKRSAHTRLGTRAQLRESVINMTVLGPCRALSPFQDRD